MRNYVRLESCQETFQAPEVDLSAGSATCLKKYPPLGNKKSLRITLQSHDLNLTEHLWDFMEKMSALNVLLSIMWSQFSTLPLQMHFSVGKNAEKMKIWNIYFILIMSFIIHFYNLITFFILWTKFCSFILWNSDVFKHIQMLFRATFQTVFGVTRS